MLRLHVVSPSNLSIFNDMLALFQHNCRNIPHLAADLSRIRKKVLVYQKRKQSVLGMLRSVSPNPHAYTGAVVAVVVINTLNMTRMILVSVILLVINIIAAYKFRLHFQQKMFLKETNGEFFFLHSFAQ
jgi:hypothetical protein